jgi:hypothetical protein
MLDAGIHDALVVDRGECGCTPRAFLVEDIRAGHEDSFTGRRHSVVKEKWKGTQASC